MKRPALIGQPVTIASRVVGFSDDRGIVLDVLPAGQFFETVDAVLVLIEAPTCHGGAREVMFKRHELKDGAP